MVGCCVAALLARFPGVRVQLVDADPAGPASPRRSASTSRCRPTPPAGATWSCTPARPSAGLQRSLDLLAPEGTVIELSWYGDREVSLPLGGAFHSGRLSIRSSQVGTVSPARRASRTFADRLALALDLLRDPAFDALITGESPLRASCPTCSPGWPPARLPALCHLITYGGE